MFLNSWEGEGENRASLVLFCYNLKRIIYIYIYFSQIIPISNYIHRFSPPFVRNNIFPTCSLHDDSLPRLNIAKGGSSVLLSSRRIVSKIVHDIIRNKSIVLQLKRKMRFPLVGQRKKLSSQYTCIYIYILTKTFRKPFLFPSSVTFFGKIHLDAFVCVCVYISWCNRLKENKMNVLFASR